jgi:hypothetical protein
MLDPNQLKICFDRLLPDDMVEPAAEMAKAENPTNRPAVHFSPGMGIAPITPFELAALTGKKWQNGRTLRISFMDGDPEVQQKIQPYAHQWSDYADIKLVFGSNPNAEIRISFQHSGSWSYLGTDALSIPKHEPTMNYGWLHPNTADDEYSRVVIHEFGHALGCYHEHQHPEAEIPWDKEAVYEMYGGPPNNWSKAQIDHNLFRRYSEQISQYSKFDEESIMLYAIPEELTIGVYSVGWNRILSKTDKEFIETMYPKDKKTTVELLIDEDPVRASIGKHGEEDTYAFVVEHEGVYRVQTGGWTDVVMSLYGPDDATKLIDSDDDSGFLRNARIDEDLKPGTYTVMVRHYRPRKTGNYSISVRLRK